MRLQIDTGSDLTHPDLIGNLWVNPGEVANNGVDDDNDGAPLPLLESQGQAGS